MVKLVKTATEFELSPTLASNEMVARCRTEGKEVLHMGFGESPFPVPPRLQESLKAGVDRKEYLPTAGYGPLCEIVAQYYKEKTGLDTDKYDVIIAPGSKLNLYALQMAVEGDLLMPVPSWVSYKPQARMLHTNVIKVPTILDDEGYHISADVLSKTIHKARAEGLNPSKLILNTPSNPTGLKIPESELPAIAKVCIEEDIMIISDEIYGLVSFDSPYSSIAKYAPHNTAVSTGLSKHLSLGGWRIGVAFIPKAIEGLHALMCNIASETWSCVPSPIQQACVDAYSGYQDIEDHMQACTDIHALMNQYISRGLKDAGIKAPMTQGAFYNYPDFAPYRDELAAIGINTSRDLAAHLMDNYSLAALPGVAFGADEKDLTLRLSGCDYDGAVALAAYQNGAVLDKVFISQYAPRVKKAVEAFHDFAAGLKKSQSEAA